MEKQNTERIYLDYAAFTPVRNEVREHINSFIAHLANPSSIHAEGKTMRDVLAEARRTCADFLNASPDEIIFTSGATEALNIAIQGSLKHFEKSADILTTQIEHSAILETAEAAGNVQFLEVDENGIIDEKDLSEKLDRNPELFVFSLVNSEIGTIQLIEEIIKTVRRHRKQNNTEFPRVILDATQAALFETLDMKKLDVDMLVLDSGKVGGLPGAGILFKRRVIDIEPILFGGGQEKGFRPGTENVVAVSAFGKALEIAENERDEEKTRVRNLADTFVRKISSEIPGAIIHGDPKNRAPHIVSVCFPETDAEWLVLALDAKGIAVSRGSACQSGKGNESEVVRVIRPACAENSVRFSFGKETKEDDIEKTISALKKVLTK